ncbi:hypothetical protein Pcinc_010885 [Petrolisthes cinctipes]|uniref:Beta-hexosaminidase n=1 Tax=Petrolisthes cinctipes TaxID=88211 RepID=A0AAE1G4H4_PETCI|nr:hypothetical protein Pcinc_010885 [Petrolisthes cinctipes]
MGRVPRTWLVCLLITLFIHGNTAFFNMPSPWGYHCLDYKCVKEENTGVVGLTTLNECKLTCGASSSLWPRPQTAQLGKTTVQFLPRAITLDHATPPSVSPLLMEAFHLFLNNLDKYHPQYSDGKVTWSEPWDPSVSSHMVQVKVTIQQPDIWLTLLTDESYQLVVETSARVTTVTIIAPTFFGARHALETLSQLIAYHETRDNLMIVTSATVRDAPAFPYRGLLLDTSRNYFSVAALERTIDAMAANKLNTFHWHITDSHSFPLNLESLPNMAYYGAYSSNSIYHPLDVVHLVKYARVRGIRLLPEFDAPAHVGSGWQWGERQGLGKLAVCVNREPWQQYCVEPPCGQLNLANPNIYKVLSEIYREMIQLFAPVDLFHYGGDEVNLNCWNTTEEMTSWMKAQKFGLDADAYYGQWSVFQEKVRQLVTQAHGGVEVPGILWTSHLTEKGRVDRYLNNTKYIIQIWTTGQDALIAELLQKQYKVIFSNYDAWYLDCGGGAWVGDGNNWCSPYSGWQKVYDNSPHAIAKALTNSTHANLILGGEAALWTEQVDEEAVDARLWPRGAALAERLWTNPSTGWVDAEYRLIHHRQRLVQRGIRAERIQPQWCHQNEGLCYL